jgi:hypothetical protein
MVMILDLNQIPYQKVLPIIEWCLNRNIDLDKCINLLEAWHSYPPKEVNDWTIDIPEEYMSFIVMKWLL